MQISCCYMKVKFYDQKLKLGRKLYFFVVVMGWILLVVRRVCLFLLFLKRSQLLRVSALWAFWGDACSKQVLTWGKPSPGQSEGMGDVLPPLLGLSSSEPGFHGCFRTGHMRGRANAFHCMGHTSWVFGLEQSHVVSKVTMQKCERFPPLSLPCKSRSDG